jgi:hypothetical protein
VVCWLILGTKKNTDIFLLPVVGGETYCNPSGHPSAVVWSGRYCDCILSVLSVRAVTGIWQMRLHGSLPFNVVLKQSLR